MDHLQWARIVLIMDRIMDMDLIITDLMVMDLLLMSMDRIIMGITGTGLRLTTDIMGHLPTLGRMRQHMDRLRSFPLDPPSHLLVLMDVWVRSTDRITTTRRILRLGSLQECPRSSAR